MARKRTKKDIKYYIRVVYGFEKKLKIVLLGELVGGPIEDGMIIEMRLSSGVPVGSWEVLEVLHTAFINQHENPNFKGLMLKCKNLDDFELLKSLRVYDEVITITQIKS